MYELITGIKKDLCTGCRSCYFVCTKQCIEMKKDLEGFIFPEVDSLKCVNCGKCVSSCHVVNDVFNLTSEKAYGFVSRREELLQMSTSGAFFSTISDMYIQNDAYVFGSVYDKQFNVVTIGTKNDDEVKQMYGSKYVYGDTLNSYPLVKELLESNNKVLYSGTPCQVAGLKSFLKKSYNNLFLIDILCHGGPSAELFKKYIVWFENKHNKKIKEYIFRDKRFGRRTVAKITFEDGESINVFPGDDPYLSSFYTGRTYRPACYECKYARRKRVGDITIGDFWGAEEYYKSVDVSKGLSAVIVNTEKGDKLLNSIKDEIVIFPTTIDTIAKNNNILDKPTENYKYRNKIYKGVVKYPFNMVANKYMYGEPLWWIKLKVYVLSPVKQFLKRIINK